MEDSTEGNNIEQVLFHSPALDRILFYLPLTDWFRLSRTSKLISKFVDGYLARVSFVNLPPNYLWPKSEPYSLAFQAKRPFQLIPTYISKLSSLINYLVIHSPNLHHLTVSCRPNQLHEFKNLRIISIELVVQQDIQDFQNLLRMNPEIEEIKLVASGNNATNCGSSCEIVITADILFGDYYPPKLRKLDLSSINEPITLLKQSFFSPISADRLNRDTQLETLICPGYNCPLNDCKPGFNFYIGILDITRLRHLALGYMCEITKTVLFMHLTRKLTDFRSLYLEDGIDYCSQLEDLVDGLVDGAPRLEHFRWSIDGELEFGINHLISFSRLKCLRILELSLSYEIVTDVCSEIMNNNFPALEEFNLRITQTWEKAAERREKMAMERQAIDKHLMDMNDTDGLCRIALNRKLKSFSVDISGIESPVQMRCGQLLKESLHELTLKGPGKGQWGIILVLFPGLIFGCTNLETLDLTEYQHEPDARTCFRDNLPSLKKLKLPNRQKNNEIVCFF